MAKALALVMRAETDSFFFRFSSQMAVHRYFLFKNVEVYTPVGFLLLPALVLCMSSGIHQ